MHDGSENSAAAVPLLWQKQCPSAVSGKSEDLSLLICHFKKTSLLA